MVELKKKKLKEPTPMSLNVRKQNWRLFKMIVQKVTPDTNQKIHREDQDWITHDS